MNLVKKTLKMGKALVDIGEKGTGNTALHMAAMKNRGQLVRWLLSDTNLDVDITNKRGETALMMAAKDGRTPIVKALLAAGADPLKKSKSGLTALKLAGTASSKSAFRVIESGLPKAQASPSPVKKNNLTVYKRDLGPCMTSNARNKPLSDRRSTISRNSQVSSMSPKGTKSTKGNVRSRLMRANSLGNQEMLFRAGKEPTAKKLKENSAKTNNGPEGTLHAPLEFEAAGKKEEETKTKSTFRLEPIDPSARPDGMDPVELLHLGAMGK